MALHVVNVELTPPKGIVTLESDIEDVKNFYNAIDELQDVEARRLAVKEAAMGGLPDPRCDSPRAAYPVNDKGEVITTSGEVPHRYRVDIIVCQRLV